MTTYERVCRVLVEEIGIEPKDVFPDKPFVEMGLDSMEMANLVLELEDEFKTEIAEDDLKKFFCPKDVVIYADSHCAIQ